MMTKELTQAITLLQYSSLDLSNFLEEQTIENPLIDLKPSEFRLRHQKKGTEKYTNPIDYIEKDEITLSEHLISQLSLVTFTPIEKSTIEYIIYLLDDNGYLYFSMDEIA